MRMRTKTCLGFPLLAVLSACSLAENGLQTVNFITGPPPQTNVVFCNIERMGTGFDHTSRVCSDAATPEMRNGAIPLTQAALALNTGQMSLFALDKGTDAVNRCGNNGELVMFHGPFPQGTPKCFNCGAEVPSFYADANAACVVLCEDVTTPSPVVPPDANVATFCAAHARVSTNVPKDGCPTGFANACTTAGAFSATFVDPRIFPEAVSWTDLINVTPGGTDNNDLTRTGVSSGSFDAGAVSSPAQWVTTGDAYVEFSAAENNLSHVLGFTALGTCTAPCHDVDGGLNGITYALALAPNGNIFILENGTQLTGPGLNGSFGSYAVNERFRISLTDLGNGAVKARYVRIVGTCTPGLACNESVIFESATQSTYPLRVDTSFNEQNATLRDVRLVRIIAQ
jgi:hypothetical protein